MCHSRWQRRWQPARCWRPHQRSCPARLPCPPPARSSRPARASDSPAWCMPGLQAAQQGFWGPSQGCNMLLVILKEMLETPLAAEDPSDEPLSSYSDAEGQTPHTNAQQHNSWGHTWGLWSLLHPVQRPDHVIDAVPDIQLLARQVLRMVGNQVCCSCYIGFFVSACNGIMTDVAPAQYPHLSVPHSDPNLQLPLHCVSEWLRDMLWAMWVPSIAAPHL